MMVQLHLMFVPSDGTTIPHNAVDMHRTVCHTSTARPSEIQTIGFSASLATDIDACESTAHPCAAVNVSRGGAPGILTSCGISMVPQS